MASSPVLPSPVGTVLALPSYGLSLETEGGREGAWDPGRPSPLSQQSCQEVVSLRLGFLLSGKRRNEAGVLWGFALLGGACEQGQHLRTEPQCGGTVESWGNAEATAHQPRF